VFIVLQEEGLDRSRNMLNAEVLGDGRVRIRFLGIPGRNYLIQTVESMGDTPWTTLATQIAGSTCLLDFIDDEAAQFPTRYYRTTSP
jgi:hypothetical protein